MGLAFSGGEIRHGTIAARPEADFLAAVNTMVLACGWVRLGDYMTGSVYKLTSPQGLTARCRLWSIAADVDLSGWPRRFVMQFQSDANPAVVGLEHVFVAGVSTPYDSGEWFSDYSVWCNPCSLFIGAVHSQTRSSFQKAVQGGIPYGSGTVTATADCGNETPPPSEATSELWFSAGDDSGQPLVFTADSTFWCLRNQHVCQRYSLCHNGAVSNVTLGVPLAADPHLSLATEEMALQVGIMRTAMFWNFLLQKWNIGFVYPDGSPIAANPLVIHQGRVLGELYDAVILSKAMDIDAVEQMFDSSTSTVTTWQNYMQSLGNVEYVYPPLTYRNEAMTSSLLLLRDKTFAPDIEVVNVAY